MNASDTRFGLFGIVSQQCKETVRQTARTNAIGRIDQTLSRQPCLKFRGRTAAEQIAHGKDIVE
jgi:hypothetical protein